MDDQHVSPSFVSLNQYASYNNTLTPSASSTATSVWSDTASQASDDTSISSNSDSDSCDAYCRPGKPSVADKVKYRPSLAKPTAEAVAPELRQNPRRSGHGSRARAACPPPLVRQCDRKVNFVDSLVGMCLQCFACFLVPFIKTMALADSSTQIVEAIWPLSSVACRSELGSKAVLPLRTFIQETLRRSRTSYSTLQVALYYLILIKPHVPKHNFTMEQPEDRHTDRALQCGRRMFLAALILASKYLQDRNYSARAWSKISGLNTNEINQNEISFLLAVNWKLHIADDVFQRWTEIVLKYTPPPSPGSPGGVSQTVAQQTMDWKRIILQLNPELTNIDGLIPVSHATSKRSDLCASSPRSILNPSNELVRNGYDSVETAPTLKALAASGAMDSVPTPGYAAGRLAPALGLLPTPRLTPQSSGLCTPAVGAGSQTLGKPSAMCLAMAQANCVSSAQHLDRLPMSLTSSPQSYCPVRRSSLATSVISTASSPESMVSDTSRSSRSSSISSVSSLASATLNNKLMASSRFRASKTVNERACQKPSVPSVPEDFVERGFSSSPESYTGPVSKLGDLSLDTPLARREQELEYMARDPVGDAARALQDLHNQDLHSAESTPVARVNRKRARPALMDDCLQENVRDILNRGYTFPQSEWTDSLVRANLTAPRKRVCCSTEAASGFQTASMNPTLNQGIWEGILN